MSTTNKKDGNGLQTQPWLTKKWFMNPFLVVGEKLVVWLTRVDGTSGSTGGAGSTGPAGGAPCHVGKVLPDSTQMTVSLEQIQQRE